jgi:hypothetical protein
MNYYVTTLIWNRFWYVSRISGFGNGILLELIMESFVDIMVVNAINAKLL